jgi:2-iminobutanoate/2-iminopropanoate deaminase
MNDLVQVQIYTPDVSLFDKFNRVYVTYFAGDLPARAFLGSGKLLLGHASSWLRSPPANLS